MSRYASIKRRCIRTAKSQLVLHHQYHSENVDGRQCRSRASAPTVRPLAGPISRRFHAQSAPSTRFPRRARPADQLSGGFDLDKARAFRADFARQELEHLDSRHERLTTRHSNCLQGARSARPPSISDFAVSKGAPANSVVPPTSPLAPAAVGPAPPSRFYPP